MQISVLLGRRAARRLGLASSPGWVTLGSERFLMKRAGVRRVVVRFAPTARARLRRARRATLHVRVQVRDRGGNARLDSRCIVVRR